MNTFSQPQETISKLQEDLLQMAAEAFGIVGEEKDRLQPTTTWKVMGADSLDVTEFAIMVEDKYHVPLADKQLNDMTCVADMANVIEAYKPPRMEK